MSPGALDLQAEGRVGQPPCTAPAVPPALTVAFIALGGGVGRCRLLLASVRVPACEEQQRSAVQGRAHSQNGVCPRPSFPAGMYEYGGKQYSMKAHPEGPSHDKCASTVLAALKHEMDCGAPQVGWLAGWLAGEGLCQGAWLHVCAGWYGQGRAGLGRWGRSRCGNSVCRVSGLQLLQLGCGKHVMVFHMRHHAPSRQSFGVCTVRWEGTGGRLLTCTAGCSVAAMQLQCTFNGAWAGNRVPSVFYVSSYFWDRASDAGTEQGAFLINGAAPWSLGSACWPCLCLLGAVGTSPAFQSCQKCILLCRPSSQLAPASRLFTRPLCEASPSSSTFPQPQNAAPPAGLVVDESAIQQSLTPGHFAQLARKACSTALDQLEAAFPRVSHGLVVCVAKG